MSDFVFDVYRIDSDYEYKSVESLFEEYNVIHWKPSIIRIIPDGYSYKYVVHWLFHFLKIFKNKHYSAVLVYDNDKLISKMIVTPSYFKFPFMHDNEIQFTHSVTLDEYKGRGINTMVKYYIMNVVKKNNTSICGVVNPLNESSVKVLKKLGMTYRFKVKRNYYKLVPFLFNLKVIEGIDD